MVVLTGHLVGVKLEDGEADASDLIGTLVATAGVAIAVAVRRSSFI